MPRLFLITIASAAALLAATASRAEERPPAWEIFAEPEASEGTTFSLDLEEPSTPPKYSLDELVEPQVTDPDVYIRFSAGSKGEAPSAPPEETAPDSSAPPSPVSPEPSERPSSPASLPSRGGGYIPLHSVKPEAPIVRNYQEYRTALENRTPEILFEGKRWVYSESEQRYVDPLQAALEEARRTQEQESLAYWSAGDIATGTGVDPFGIPFGDPWLLYPEQVSPDFDAAYFPTTRRTEGFRLGTAQKRAFGPPEVEPYDAGAGTSTWAPGYPADGYRLKRGQRRAVLPGAGSRRLEEREGAQRRSSLPGGR